MLHGCLCVCADEGVYSTVGSLVMSRLRGVVLARCTNAQAESVSGAPEHERMSETSMGGFLSTLKEQL